MRKTYIKIIINEIKQSFGRFLAIFGIVSLGVGFLSGLLVTTPDMHYSVDEYYDNSNMTDIFIKGTMGLTDDDIDIISSMEEIEELMPAYVIDVLMENQNDEVMATRVYGLPFLKNNININKLELVDGRIPENNNECVIERKGGFLSSVPIGSKLKISTENDDYEDMDDIFNVQEFTVVGIVSNSFYFSMERETTNIGIGRLNSIIYVDDSSYALDVYTDVYMTVNGAKELDSFTTEYEEKIKSVTRKLEILEKERSEVRYNEVLSEATDKLNEGKADYEEGKLEAEKELADALKEIEDGKKELQDAWIEIQDGKKELEDAKIKLQEEVEKAEKEIADAKKELEDAYQELKDGEIELQDAWEKLQEGQKEYLDGYADYLDGKKELEDAQAKFDEGEREYLDGLRQLEDAKREIRRGERELLSAEEQLENGLRQYNEGVKELERGKQDFENGFANYLQGLPYSSAEELFTAIDKGDAGAKFALDSAVAGSVQYIEGEINKLQTNISGLEMLVLQKRQEIALEEDKDKKDILEIELKGYEESLNDAKEGLAILEAQYKQMPKDSSIFITYWNGIKNGERQLANAKAELEFGQRKIEKGNDEIRLGKREIQKAERELEDAKVELEENHKKLEDAWADLEEGKIKLEDARIELEDGFKKYYDGKKELEDGWAKYYDGLKELADAEETLKREVEDANEEIRKGENDLNKGLADYYKGQEDLIQGERDYLDAKAEVEQELAKAEAEILDAEKEIAELKKPKWYVLDRNHNMSYASFLMNAEKVEAVSKVFPIFFYLIAALVALTTMTRMVEEERTQIGTLKALGYTKGTIMLKYLIYCGFASVLGSVLGLFVGFKLIPYVLWNAYGTMYHLPGFLTQFDIKIASISSGMAIFSTMIATIYAVNEALKEKPSTLMLPRAPKAGKRILLERVGFIWSRLSFYQKATARNIFRYKKHFFMTVIGIGGCTALLVAGFGIRDSIGKMANTQFQDIFKYNIAVDFDIEKELNSEFDLLLDDSTRISDYIGIYKEKAKVINDQDSVDINIVSPDKSMKFNDFVDLRDRIAGENIIFDDSSVIITEKLAETLNLSKGEEILIERDDETISGFIVTDITENYLGNYLYISRDNLEQISNNAFFIKIPLTNQDDLDDLISDILSSENILNADLLSQTKRTFDNLLSSINYIVIVIILASGTLAFIVLYNLTNININERKKELATLKVLGYYDGEVSRYVFRETAILTLIGIGLGLILGNLLHIFIIHTIEYIDFMFGRDISALSYILSTIITLIFSFIVNLFMYKKLLNIEMVESMKAID